MPGFETTDALTGLYTYGALRTYLSSVPSDMPLGMLCIELDDPARFNDAFGYNTDKEILLRVVRSIESLIGEMIFARIGTYSFVIVHVGEGSADILDSLAHRIINLLREPIDLYGNLFYMTASIGIGTTSGSEECDFATLLKHTEYAMKEAQRTGSNRIVFSQKERGFSYEQELRLLKDLPSAIEYGEIYFVYQGQYDYSAERFVGAEILARWEHPQFGNIPPSVFIPLAEKSGMIAPLMTRTLINASSVFKILDAKGIEEFSLSINLPFEVLMEESFPDTVEFILDAYELRGRSLTFEIMEDTIPDHIESFISRLESIKRMGFRLAVDDYGTGHTSLRYLLYFPVDYLKIDRSFVKGIEKSERTLQLFRSIVDTANALSLDIIVEGVENESEDRIVREFGALTVQGYHYSMPVEERAFLASLCGEL